MNYMASKISNMRCDERELVTHRNANLVIECFKELMRKDPMFTYSFTKHPDGE